MKYNFDEIVDRRNTDCVKYDRLVEVFGTNDIIPMWIADMDFRTPDIIFEAIEKRMKHPVLGYTMPPDDYFSIISNWVKQHHQWNIKEEWLGFLPGIVQGLSFAVQIFSNERDDIIIQPPVYHPFIHVVEKNNRNLIYNPLNIIDGHFEMDFDDLERKITPKTRLLILCSPHNPGGKVWDKSSLTRLAEICGKHNITVISDEIHADMVLEGYRHTPFASVSEIAADISITFMAPSKTFNMPGLISSYYIVSNPDLRKKMEVFLDKNELLGGNVFAYAATLATYEYGDTWRMEMLEYIQGNVNLLMEFIQHNIPQIKPIKPEASFLVFLNCKNLGLEPDELQKFFIHEAGLGLNDGRMFGPGGEYYLRLNIACPRSILREALEKLKSAVDKRNENILKN